MTSTREQGSLKPLPGPQRQFRRWGVEGPGEGGGQADSPDPDVGMQLPRRPGLAFPQDLGVVPEAAVLGEVWVVVDHDHLAHLQVLPLDGVSGSSPDIL